MYIRKWVPELRDLDTHYLFAPFDAPAETLKKAGIKPAKLTKAPPFLVPWILLLPNWLFRVIAQQMLAIDPLARSSMWDDLQKGRPTEIEFLNQAVVELAFQQGLTAPVNERIVGLIREAESSGGGSPGMSSSDMVSRLL